MLGSLVVLATLLPPPAHAQHADAGVEQKAATPLPAPPADPPPAEPDNAPAAGDEPSGVLPKTINPNQLSEDVRARLAERAAVRHPGSLPTNEPTPRNEASPAAAPGSVPPYRPRVAGADALRRAQGRTRVHAVETAEGVTLLSNRIQLPESRISAAIARQPLPPPEPPVVEERAAAAVADAPNVTEMHSLRPISSRPARAKDASTGLGWLLWPFVLFVTTGAVVGTLWFRKNTE